MLDFLFTIGQAASTMLMIYGAVLVLMPASKAAAPRVEHELAALKTIHTDA